MRTFIRAVVVLVALNVVTYVAYRRLVAQAGGTSDWQLKMVWKRLFDIAVSSIALVVLSPVFLMIALVMKLTSPGPLLYRATRIGQNGKRFKLYKFRSMVVDADKMGPGITASADARVTPIGRILRKTKLDELPQLINVLRGEMSIVGPRPEDPRYVEKYTAEQAHVLDVKPGITSPASVKYRDEEAILNGRDWETKYLTEVMPAKLEIDLDYVKNPSVVRDLRIILRTVQAVLN
jgi:lipopolysaccharide/colanic/teichoic acid biosynthesis glycosyltransferase